MVNHFEMEGPSRYRQLRNHANRRNICIRHLRDRFNPLEEYHNEDFRLRFRLRKDSVIDLVKNLEKDLQHQTRRRLPLTPMQQVLIALRFYATETFQRVIGDLFGVSAFAACTAIHKVSKAIYCETKSTIPVIPRKPGWYKEKVLWCCTLSRCDRGHRLYPHQDDMSKQRKCYGIC